jgi:hypothetical protein
MVALAPRCTRLRAGFVVHRKTDFLKRAAGETCGPFPFEVMESDVTEAN